jgi:TolB-like protein/cytochrome c-type biogenesis protein CcmH/NrfG
VFLSYAREDAEAVRRIADALRAFGVEVWFDQNELRGGDAWDAKIRTQIRTCALCIPVISAATQSRGEGYFRREWKFAVERTHDMAAGVAFLMPVVIDDTAESAALVPDEFMRVQWTRLDRGVPTPQFVEQVKKLLENPRKSAPVSVVGASLDDARGRRQAAPLQGKRSVPGWSWGVIVAIVVAITTALVVSRKPEPPAAPPKLVADTKPSPPASPKLSDKSIAVLPFTNMSEDKDSGFFADGVHEDILTNLALIRELRVVSRTSVMPYRTTAKSMRQIAEELGVTYILEGSVRRSGNKVRVTGQLIHAASDEHVWARSYDRDLTDVFTIQAELSQQIAGALKTALSPEEKVMIARRPTENPAAYDLLLRARQLDRNGNDTRQELETQEAMLQSAVTLDPAFAGAWAALGVVHAQIRFNAIDTSEARLAKARTANDTARQLDPDGPEVIAGTGVYFYYALRDYPRALEQFGRMARQWPNNYIGPFMTGLVQRRQGQWLDSLTNLRRAAELDPGSAEIARNLMISLVGMRRYPEAVLEQERRVRLLPESLRESFEVVRLKYFVNGATREGDELLAGPIAERAGPAVAAGYRKLWAAMKGDLATVARLDREHPEAWAPFLGSGGGSPAEYALQNAIVMAAQGDLAGARARVEKYPAELRARLVSEPQNSVVLALLAQIEALLGHKAEALAAAQQARALMPDSVDALSARTPRFALAVVLAWTGDKEAACAELRQLLAIGGNNNVHVLRNGPTFTPLKGDPRFEALLNDPKNNEPLF